MQDVLIMLLRETEKQERKMREKEYKRNERGQGKVQSGNDLQNNGLVALNYTWS